ncbi:MAG: cobalamin-dependent protein [Pseudomonadota bacterium]
MDDLKRSAQVRRPQDSGAVTSLASQALSELARKRANRDERIMAALTEKLEAAVLDRNPHRRIAVLAEMRAEGIADTVIAETCIPEVARRLGDAWCEDHMSFADVTIGSARLQAMVRDLGGPDPEDGRTQGGRVAVIVTGDETHTLGAMVLTNQLRRLGISVRLILGKDEASVIPILAECDFDAIMISASHSEKLVSLGNFVEKIRRGVPSQTPIIVGGSVVERGNDVLKRTGADYATTNVHEALQLCGLTTTDTQPSGRLKAMAE